MLLQSARGRGASWVMTLSLSVLACSVDQRKLHQAAGAGASDDRGDGGDASRAGQGGHSGTGPDATGGGGSTPSTLPPLIDGCADLDTDGVADCSVTLARNAAFESDVDGWAAADGVALAWDPKNALGDEHSGSALLTAEGSTDIEGSALFRASQCLAASAGQLVIAYANAWVAGAEEEGDGAAHTELDVSYFESENCTGSATGYFATPRNMATGTWVTVQAGGVTAPATASILVELIGVKPHRTASLRAYFDNVMVKLEPL
jgi:hypothetical protein